MSTYFTYPCTTQVLFVFVLLLLLLVDFLFLFVCFLFLFFVVALFCTLICLLFWFSFLVPVFACNILSIHCVLTQIMCFALI